MKLSEKVILPHRKSLLLNSPRLINGECALNGTMVIPITLK